MERKADGLDEWTDLLVCEGLNGWRKKLIYPVWMDGLIGWLGRD